MQVKDQVDIDVIVHYCCRDRNLLGMQMDLLGALGFERQMSPQEGASDPEGIEAGEAEFAALARRALEAAPPYAEWIAAVTQPS